MTQALEVKQIGSYRISQTLGQGAFGIVYKGYQPFLERHVAIKTLLTDVMEDEASERQFMREARTIAQLRHPNIVAVYEFGTVPQENKPLTYMTMEYLPGQTLNRYVKDNELTQANILHIIEQLAAALDYAHKHGVVHRDLKPANILFTDQGEPVIVDFGLAQLVKISRENDAQETDTLSGTPDYMAPEQVVGETTTPAVDQYALATIAYELLCGTLPFAGETLSEILIRRVQQPPPPITQHKPHLPEELDIIFAQALNQDPSSRYESAGKFAKALSKTLMPQRYRPQIVTVVDPIQAAQLNAARHTLSGFMWGLAVITLIAVLFSVGVFLRAYRDGTPELFLWNGTFIEQETQVINSIWPGSSGARAGYQPGDVIPNDSRLLINGTPAMQLPDSYQLSLGDQIERTVNRNGETVTLAYTVERSDYQLLLLFLHSVPSFFAFGCSVWLLRRWGAELGMQIFYPFLLAASFTLITCVLVNFVVGIISLAMGIMLPTMLHFVLAFPTKSKFVENNPRAMIFLYWPALTGLIEFLIGDHITLTNTMTLFDVTQALYGAAILVAVYMRWIRREIRHYPELWWLISAFMLAIVFWTAPTWPERIALTDTATEQLIAYLVFTLTISAAVTMAVYGYHRLQKHIGPSLIIDDTRMTIMV
jgi:tRNA A-37 threonylcarbamoyl transferase component Bud32